MRASAIALLASMTALGCGSSYGDGSGTSEPLVVVGATFNSGELPNDATTEIPSTTSMSSGAFAGGPDKTMAGRASLNAYGIALRMKGAGTGYWTLPVGLPDLVDPGIDWSLKLRFTRTAPLGLQQVLIAQTDVNGKFSKPTEVPFTIKSLVPDGTKVISLVWHNHADLDLQVQSPDGKITSAKRPNTAIVPKGYKSADGPIAGSGTLDRDSNSRCAFDGLMRVDVVFTDDPTPGDYLVWVDLYDSCGEPATTFDLQLHENAAEAPTYHSNGQLLDINADNGTGAGLFMHTFSF